MGRFRRRSSAKEHPTAAQEHPTATSSFDPGLLAMGMPPKAQVQQEKPPPPRERRRNSLMGECRCKIFHISGLNGEIDNLPHLKTCVDELSDGLPPSNVLITLSGNFLTGSLMSTLDHGRGVVDMLNALPVSAVCLGSHEADLPHLALLQRLNELRAPCLVTNMPSFAEDEPELADRKCPSHVIANLAGPRGPEGSGRTLGLLGLCGGGGTHALLYREGAFNGHAARITPPVEAIRPAVARLREMNPGVDCIVPLTCQPLEDDARLVADCTELGIPVILGGHEATPDTAGSRVLKPGDGAYKCVVVEMTWTAGAPSPGPPTSVNARIVHLAPPLPDKDAAAAAFRAHGMVGSHSRLALEKAFKVFDQDNSGTLSAEELKAILTKPIRGRPARGPPAQRPPCNSHSDTLWAERATVFPDPRNQVPFLP